MVLQLKLPVSTTHAIQMLLQWRGNLLKSIDNKIVRAKAEVSYNANYVNVNYSVKNSTVDYIYLLFLHDFFFRLKPKQYKKCQYK